MAGKDFKGTTKRPKTGQADKSFITPEPLNVHVPEGYRIVKQSKSERIQLLVTPHVKERLQELAEVEGISLNALANNIFQEYIDSHKKKK